MLRRVSCANAPRAVMASDAFIFPKQWNFNQEHRAKSTDLISIPRALKTFLNFHF